MTDSQLLSALRTIAQFKENCGDRAKFALTYPVVRDGDGRNLRQALEDSGFTDFRSVTDSLEKAGFIITHGWKGKSGVKGFVLRITPQGAQALRDAEKPARSAKPAKSGKPNVTDVDLTQIIGMLVKALSNK